MAENHDVRRRLQSCIMTAIAVLLPAWANAQTYSNPLPADAQRALERGDVAVEQQEWALAIRYFNEAYKITPHHPDTLFNLGLAESKVLGRELRSVAWLKGYLAAVPNATNSKAVLGLITSLEVSVEARVESLIHEARQMAAQLPNDAEKKAAYAIVAVTQAIAGDVAGAIQTASAVEDDSALKQIVQAIAKTGDVQAAKQLLGNRIKSDVYKSSGYQDIAVIQAGKGDIAGAKSTLDHSTLGNCKHEGYIAIAKAQLQAGRRAEAFQSLADAREAIRRSEFRGGEESQYYDIATAQAELGDVQGAIVTAGLIVRPVYMHMVYNGVRGALSPTFEATLAKGDWRGAQQVADMIPDALGKADFYATLAQNRIKAQDFPAATEYIEQIPDAAWEKARVIADLVNGLVSAKKLDEARRVLSQVQRGVGNLSDYHMATLLDATVGAGDLAFAKELYQSMSDEKRSAYDVKASAGRLVATLTAAGDLAEATRIAGNSDELLVPIVTAQLAKGDARGALKTAAAVTSATGRSVAYYNIANHWARSGMFSEALDAASLIVDSNQRDSEYGGYGLILSEALSVDNLDVATVVIDRLENPTRKDDAISGVAKYLSQVGKFANAKKWAERIQSPSDKVSVYLSIASDQYDIGLLAASGETMSSVGVLLMEVADPDDSADRYLKLSSQLLALGDLAQARDAVRLAASSAERIADDRARRRRQADWASVRKAALDAGLLAEAKESVWKALEGDASPDLLDELARTGSLSRSKTMAGQLPSQTDRDAALSAIAGVLLEGGNLVAAMDVATKISSLADNYLSVRIVTKLFESGKFDEAESVMQAISDENYKERALAKAAIAFYRTGNLAKAVRYSAEVKDGYRRSDICSALAEAGDVASATQIAESVTDSAADFCWGNIGSVLAKSGDVEGAKQLFLRIKGSDRQADLLKAIVEAGGGRWAQTMYASLAESHYKCSVVIAIADSGDIAWAMDAAWKVRNKALQDSLLQFLAPLQGRSDTAAACTTARAIRQSSKRLYALRGIARAELTAGREQGAIETLGLLWSQEEDRPSDLEIRYWTACEIAQLRARQEDLTKALETVAALEDARWRSRAYRAIMSWRADPGEKAIVAALIPDTDVQSLAYRDLVRLEASNGRLREAVELSKFIPDVEYRLQTFGELVATAIVKGEYSAVLSEITKLPEATATAYLCLDLGEALIDSQGAENIEELLASALRSAAVMPRGIWQARTYAEIGELASRSGFQALRDDAERLASASAASLSPEDQQRLRTGMERSSAAVNSAAAPQEVEAAERRDMRIDKWTRFVDGSLDSPLFTDFPSHLQSVSSKTTPLEIVRGLCSTAQTLTGQLSAIYALEAEIQK